MNRIPSNILSMLQRAIPQLEPQQVITYSPPASSCCASGPTTYLRTYCIDRGYTVERIGTGLFRISNKRLPRQRKTLLQAVAQFASAITGPTVPTEVAASRHHHCMSNTCGWLITAGTHHYCGACDCPHTPLSELSYKTTLAVLACPCIPPLWSQYILLSTP